MRTTSTAEHQDHALADEIKRRIDAAGFDVLDGLLAHDTASMDNFAL